MILGYQVTETLYESSRSLICRGQRDSDSVSVVLKQLKPDYCASGPLAEPQFRGFTRFQREYETTRCLDLKGVIKVYGLESHDHSLVMIEEDFGAESLDRYVLKHSLSLTVFLQLAIQIVDILGEVHQRRVLHRDINPSNILLNPATGAVKLADFGTAIVLPPATSSLLPSPILEGTLAYLSPEQTGRMNRAVDYRTDFYALGVTFYQLLCGRLPFESNDALELIHSHIAKHPTPVDQINPQIPQTVSAIVMKLMAKSAEDRYQSTWGIKADLQACLSQLQQQGSIDPFALGQQDRSEQFQIPQKLYGRASDIQTLLTAFKRVANIKRVGRTGPRSSTSEIVLISGAAGIGKSALVQEVYKPLTQHGGYLISGKAALLHQNTPYFPFVQAFQALVRQLLAESESQIAVWREKLSAALGANGRVIVDVIPEVELILGQQPAVPNLAAAESQNRFKLMFQKFIQVFTQPEHPLVIFLDDLQWADRASLDLIQLVITAPESQSLLLIGTYREQEVNTNHPLQVMLHQLQNQRVSISSIVLAPLASSDLDQLVAETLHSSIAAIKPLSALIAQKTEGNLLFATELLKFLHQEQLIWFDPQQSVWQWQLEPIQRLPLADTLVEFVLERLHRLSEPAKHLLQQAACLGERFTVQMLSTISQKSRSEVKRLLDKAVQASLLLPVGWEEPAPTASANQSEEALGSYQFGHDRIQQAARSLLSEPDRQQMHLQIGQLLLQTTPVERLENNIFEIVNQLNLGIDLIRKQSQKDELARLNWIAGNKAKSSVAYTSALNYLNIAKDLLGERGWERNYELTLALYHSLTEAAYLNSDFAAMEQSAETVLQQTRSLLDQLKVYEIRIQVYTAQNKLSDAIDTALQTLQQLGIHIPPQPQPADILQQAEQTKLALANRSVADLANLPQMTDEYQLGAMRVIASVCTPTYFTMPDLWQLMVFQKIQLSVNYGNAPGSAFGYGDYGMVLCAVDGDIETGYQFAQLAATLLPQLNAKEFVPKTLLLINCYLRQWKEHLRATLEPLQAAYQCGLETGDLEFATFAIAFRDCHAYWVGQELAPLEQEMAAHGSTIAQFNQAIPLHLNQLYRQVILNLLGKAEHLCELTGESYQEQTQYALHQAADDQYALFHFNFNKLILCYLFEDFTQSIAHAREAEQRLSQQAAGMLVIPGFYFYQALIKLAVFDQVDPAEQAQILQQVDQIQAKMKYWADHAPMNYLHKYHLVQAERQRVLGQDLEAMDDYDRAIALAQEHRYLNEEALAHELAAKFYLNKGKPKIAQVYLRDAHYCYLSWGALAKVKALETRYAQLLEPSAVQSPAALTASPTTARTALQTLDLATVMKSAQALTREIVLDQLLTKLMQILIENAGAERGYLILELDGQLVIEAEGTANSAPVLGLRSLPINHEEALDVMSTGVIHYVARTRESIVLGNASQDERFLHDPYIVQHQPKSVLCAPLINQSQLIGIVYLENNLTADAFTSNHLEIVQLLSAQAAISIDNARLYDQLDIRVQQRTDELMRSNQQLAREVLERQRSEETLRLIVEGTAAVTSKDFFHSLVRSLAKALNVRYAFITECDSSTPTHLRAIACWYENEFGENFEYDVHGTPCEQVISSQGCQCYPEQLQSYFPDDSELMDIEAQSYAGIALLDSAGKLLGHLAVLDSKPIADVPRNTAILEIFAARAAAEMERQQAETAIRVSQEKFAKAFRSSPSGITLTTIQEGRFIEANDSFLRLLGYDREEVIGQSSLDLNIWVKAEDRETITQLLQAQGTVSNLEIELRRKSGETFLGLISAEIIDLEDQPCLLGVTTDITVLKQAAKALERLAEIGELASMIVHEVRNPLTTMLMGLNAFKRLELPERFQEYLLLSLEEGDRLQRLLNQILLYAKPQTLNLSELELNALITDTLNALRETPAAVTKRLELTSTFTPAGLSADRDKLKQVLINLVTNACEAAPDQAVITVSLQQCRSDAAQIQVHNPGDPIPPDVLEKLTKPFFTTKSNGNGLGLAIVKRIVEAHAGELRIESSAGAGTTVTVNLPLKLPLKL